MTSEAKFIWGIDKNSVCTHRYSQGPEEADSWCPMSAFPSDHSAGVQWHAAIFTVNKQMLHLGILKFPPATTHKRERNNVSKHVSRNQIIQKYFFNCIFFNHRKLQHLKIFWFGSTEDTQNTDRISGETSLVAYVWMHTLCYGIKFLFYCGTIEYGWMEQIHFQSSLTSLHKRGLIKTDNALSTTHFCIKAWILFLLYKYYSHFSACNIILFTDLNTGHLPN